MDIPAATRFSHLRWPYTFVNHLKINYDRDSFNDNNVIIKNVKDTLM
jgi:hypothetical protein